MERGITSHLNKFESSSIKVALCQVWLKLAQWFWRARLLNVPVTNVLSLFCYFLSLENGMTLLLKKTWIHFHQGCFEPDLVKIGPLVFWRAKFLNGTCINVLSLFPNYLPFIWRHLNSLYPNKGMAIQLNKPESPSTKDALCQVCLKLA